MTGGLIRRVVVDPASTGERLDRCLAAALDGLSRARLQDLIRQGAVTSAGRTLREASHRVKHGDVLDVSVPEAEDAAPAGEAIALAVPYEDDELIVIDKPAGLVVHPAAGHASGTLVNALIAHCGESLSGIGGVKRPGIVHRLDKDTSGLMVVAKTDRAHKGLAEQFASHGADGRLERRYRAFVWGGLPRPSGTIDAPLGRSTANRLKIAVAKGGRRAVTHWRVLRRFGDKADGILVCEVEATLETGRTHQIRVHFAHVGHPLLGDAVYGSGFRASARRLELQSQDALASLGRQALHAVALGFVHPVSGRKLRFESPYPVDLARLAKALEREHASTG